MAERELNITTAVMLFCEECKPGVNEVARTNCPLYLFQQEFDSSCQTKDDLQMLAEKHNLSATFYVEQNGVPHFTCPENKGLFPGKIAIFITKPE